MHPCSVPLFRAVLHSTPKCKRVGSRGPSLQAHRFAHPHHRAAAVHLVGVGGGAFAARNPLSCQQTEHVYCSEALHAHCLEALQTKAVVGVTLHAFCSCPPYHSDMAVGLWHSVPAPGNQVAQAKVRRPELPAVGGCGVQNCGHATHAACPTRAVSSCPCASAPPLPQTLFVGSLIAVIFLYVEVILVSRRAC